jgi:hypothetical protein
MRGARCLLDAESERCEMRCEICLWCDGVRGLMTLQKKAVVLVEVGV